MTLREKIIVGMTLLALVWAGMTFLLDARQSAPGESPVSEASAVASATFVAQSQARLASVMLSPAERLVLEAAQAEWSGVPFGEGHAPAGTTNRPARKPAAYAYTGFIQAGSRRLAIVNGREYQAGEPLEGGQAVVEQIEPSHLILRSTSDAQRQLISFQESF